MVEEAAARAKSAKRHLAAYEADMQKKFGAPKSTDALSRNPSSRTDHAYTRLLSGSVLAQITLGPKKAKCHWAPT